MSELNRTAIPSESKSSAPADTTPSFSGNSDTLFEWLGSFWSEVYGDPDFVRELQSARAMRVAQLYLDLLENLKLEDRENAPVFHRERWHPVVLRRSTRNTGSAGMSRLTSGTTGEVDEGGPVPKLNLGVQRSEVYGECTVVTLGGVDANYRGMVVYPLDGASSDLKSAACATNGVTDASVVMEAGVDFAVLDGAIAVSERCDPFDGENAGKFPKFEIVGEPGGAGDVETVLWVCDAMFDRDLVYRALGYAMRLPSRASETYKRVVNAAWNAVASGATPLLVRSLMASICGIPTVKEDGEVVEHVNRFSDGLIQVITDRNVYSLEPGSELRKNVRRGAALRRFDTLDKAIRVYACTTDARRLPEYNDFLDDFDEFTEDVPAIDLPPALFRSSLRNGFSVSWALEDVVYCGPDANGNPRLRFRLGGSVEDEDRFWADTWKRYEESGKSMVSCLEGVTYDTIYEVGAVWTQISPMEFFMHNLIGANTLIITVRTDTLADDAPLYDPKFFGVVRECVPSYIRLYVVEHSKAGSERKCLAGSSDETDLYVGEEYEDSVSYQPFKKRKRGGRTHDRVDSKWVASCRGYNEEEDEDY